MASHLVNFRQVNMYAGMGSMIPVIHALPDGYHVFLFTYTWVFSFSFITVHLMDALAARTCVMGNHFHP
jgi:uncharacterized protein (DUF4213/DUF364 family)